MLVPPVLILAVAAAVVAGIALGHLWVERRAQRRLRGAAEANGFVAEASIPPEVVRFVVPRLPHRGASAVTASLVFRRSGGPSGTQRWVFRIDYDAGGVSRPRHVSRAAAAEVAPDGLASAVVHNEPSASPKALASLMRRESLT